MYLVRYFNLAQGGILAALLTASALLPGFPAQAEEGDGSLGQSFVVEYSLMEPSYFCGINGSNDSAASPGKRYLALVEEWAAKHQDTPADPSKSPAGTSHVRPNIVAWLGWPQIDPHKGNELLTPRAIHIEITKGSAAMLDELDAIMASPGEGLAPLRSTLRYDYDSYARLLNPEGFAPRDVVVDGKRLRYPDETDDGLDRVVQSYFSLYGKRKQKQASLDLAMAQSPGVRFGPVAEIAVAQDGALNIRSIPVPWDFIPAGVAPDFNTSMQYRPEDKDEDTLRRLRSCFDRPTGQDRRSMVSRTGVVLVYPLLPAERWEPGHEDAYYALDPSVAELTQPLHDAYRAVAEEWIAARPSFADEAKTQDFASIVEHGWGGTETRIVKGAEYYTYKHIAFLSFELQVYTVDQAALDELRAKLDAVAGVHPRVERSFVIHDYGSGSISMGD